MNPIEFVKKHPLMTGGLVLGALVLFFVLASSGGGTATVSDGGGSQMGDATAGAQLQALQVQTSAQLAQASMAKEIALGEQATAKTIAELQAQIEGKGLDVSQALGLANISAQKETSLLQTTLSAKATEAQIAAQVERDRIQQSTILGQANIMAKMQANANKPKGLFSFLFG